jgi:2-polyprenyl-3-methyl-5-hydroxy-6-metoxy-1,4-benzoquinol methylase
MQTARHIDTFISNSSYRDAVDIKKLKFIFSAIRKYAEDNNRTFEELRILEIACGMGGITLPLASLGCKVVALDIDRNSVKHVEKIAKERQFDNLHVSVEDGCKFSDDSSYDIIVASEVFEHVLNPTMLAENIAKRMNKRSYLIVTTPNGFGPWELKNRLSPTYHLRKSNWLRKRLRMPYYVKGNGADHCQFYTKNRLISLFSELSLEPVEFSKSDSILTIFAPLRKIALLGKIDIKLADMLPHYFASGWYFVFEMH